MPSTIAVHPHPNRATSLRVACEKSVRALVSAMRRAVPGKVPPEAMNDLVDSFTDALERSAQLLLAGKHVRVVEDDETLTTQEAADLLDVSRPHLIKLLETEQIPQRATVGRHRRLFATLRNR